MKIILNQIKTDEFDINPFDFKGKEYILIKPKKFKFKWSSEEYHLRSIICDKAGKIVCSGFPKFKNLGEDSSESKRFLDYLSEGKVVFSEKFDGSLIIRSVIDGEVSLRTRGSNSLGEFEEAVLNIISSKYPKLLDSNLHQDKSILLEYISPENKIVVNYNNSDLILLGYMQHYSDKYPSFKYNIENISDLNLNPTKLYSLSNNLDDITNFINSKTNFEGIVCWCNFGELLVKIKSKQYLNLHYLRYALSEEFLSKMLISENIYSKDEAISFLISLGYDYEIISYVDSYIESYLQNLKKVNNYIETVKELFNYLDLSRDRKSIALEIKNVSKGNSLIKSLCFALLDKDLERVKDIRDSLVLNVKTNALASIKQEVSDFIIKTKGEN